MKKFKNQEIRDLLNQVYHEEISFSRMVEILNEMVSEAEKKCVEDMPKRKFKKGDKVRIKHGISSRTHWNISPEFMGEMDDLIGKTMTVDRYTDRNKYVACEGIYWSFLEEWLEPYEELKKDDLAIFWDDNKRYAVIKLYERLKGSEEWYYKHEDNNRSSWKNAVKFESKEQFERLLKGEI